MAIPPRIRFLQRMQKKISNNNVKIEKEIDQISTNSADNSEQEDSDNNSDKSEILNNKNNERIVKEENTAALQFGKKRIAFILNYKFLIKRNV